MGLRQRTHIVNLPSVETVRWTLRKKALVVRGIKDGLISSADAQAIYCISPEELRVWFFLVEQFGPKGLRATRTQDYFPPTIRRPFLAA